MGRRAIALAALAALGFTSNAHASLAHDDFTYIGPTQSKWSPGPNNATTFAHVAPAGPQTPGSATFSIMGAGFSDVSGSDGGHTGNTQAITALAVPGWSTADYVNVINTALNTWAAVSGFTNLGQVADGNVNAGASQATNGHLGDIRVAAWEIASALTLAHAFQPGTEALFGAGGTVAGDLHFDVTRTWVDDPTDTNADADFDIYTVALHEIGHALGLGHSTVVGSVMEATYAGARRTLHADDIAGIQAIYGLPVPEPTSVAIFGIISTLGLLRRRQRTGAF